MAAGRPVKYNYDDIVKRLNAYIAKEDNPIIAKFCLQKDTPCRDTLHEVSKTNQNLSDAIKRAIAKQEVYAEEGAMNGTVNPTFAIFKLKQPQHGWTDKQQIDSTINATVDIVKLSPEQRKDRIAELMDKYKG